MEAPQVLLILNCKSHRIHRGLIIHGQKLVDERCNTDALIDFRDVQCSPEDESGVLDNLYPPMTVSTRAYLWLVLIGLLVPWICALARWW